MEMRKWKKCVMRIAFPCHGIPNTTSATIWMSMLLQAGPQGLQKVELRALKLLVCALGTWPMEDGSRAGSSLLRGRPSRWPDLPLRVLNLRFYESESSPLSLTCLSTCVYFEVIVNKIVWTRCRGLLRHVI